MTSLTDFRDRITGLDEMAARASLLVPFLAYFLEENGQPVTGAKLLGVFDELRIRRPTRISDVLSRSKDFVRVRDGRYQLSHSGRLHVLAKVRQEHPLASFKDQPTGTLNVLPSKDQSTPHASTQNVFVIYGRDEALRSDLFALLRTMGCHPLEFSEVVHQSGSASPYTWEAIRDAFDKARACVVLFSPDESAMLREELQDPARPEKGGFQPRQNVFIESGMAMALQPTRTILVRVGSVRDNSDFGGRQYIDLDGSAISRNKLKNALEKAGCLVFTRGDDWLTVGRFKANEGDLNE